MEFDLVQNPGNAPANTVYTQTLEQARNNVKLLQALEHEQNRSAHYYCVIVLVRFPDDPQPLIGEGV